MPARTPNQFDERTSPATRPRVALVGAGASGARAVLQEASGLLDHRVVERARDLEALVAEDTDAVVIDGPIDRGIGRAALARARSIDRPVVLVHAGTGPSVPAWGSPAIVATADGLAGLVRTIVERSRTDRFGVRDPSIGRLVSLCTCAARSQSPEDAIRVAFTQLCDAAETQYGELWRPVGAEAASLVLDVHWTPEGADPALAPAMRSGLPIVSTVASRGLPVVAWSRSSPVVIRDLVACPQFVRGAQAARFGLEGAVSIPVRVGGGSWAVLLLFLRRSSITPGRLRTIRTLVGAIGNLLELKLSERDLAATRSLLDSTFASLEEAVVVVESRSRRIVQCNEAAVRLLGYPRDALIDMATIHLHESEADWVRFGIDSTASIERSGVHRGRHRMRRADGTIFPSDHTVTRIVEDGQPTSLVVNVIRDRTETERAEAEQDRLRNEFAHVGRVALVGQLAAGILHAMSQPLFALDAHLARAVRMAGEAATESAGELPETLEDARRQVERLGEILGQLRGMVKRQAMERSTVDVNEVVRAAVGLLERTAVRQGASMRVNLAGDMEPIQADRVQLEQVVVNLVQNAMDAVAESPPPRRIDVSTRRTPTGITVCVNDSGPGCALSSERAFEPFVTTKESGLGLGLAMSRFIVESHGGMIEFDESRENGASIIVSIPIRDSARKGPIP